MRNVAIVPAILLLSVVGIASAQVLWQENGVPICTAEGDQAGLQMISDGAGGAIIVWRDEQNDEGDIYVQRVDRDGNVLWTDGGVPISVRGGSQSNPVIITDGVSGAIIAWEDWSFGGAIYAQRVNSERNSLWAEDGVLIAGAPDQWQPTICSDGANGAIIAWVRGPGEWMDIYAQRVGANGQLQWQEGGVPICAATYMQSQPKTISDGEGGAVIAWLDLRNYQAIDGIYAQRVSRNGSVLWQTDGVEVVDWGALSMYIASDVCDP